MTPDVAPIEARAEPDYRSLATLGIPFWALGAGTTGWLVARNFRDDLEPLPPEVSVLAWTVGTGAALGGAGALDLGTARSSRARGEAAGLSTVGLGMLAASCGLLVADAGLWTAFPDARGGGGTAEAVAVGAVSLGVLAGVPGLWEWAADGLRRDPERRARRTRR
ncbi:MAG: hypothetical protein H6735_15305 [Alphaproteobacteria bacterium]|nr:hypothetical protein [Alphaproteobacteria bacterium]